MSFPSVLGPWFVVQRLSEGDPRLAGGGPPDDVHVEYYTSMEEGVLTFQRSKKLAMLFMSLASAARVAAAEGAEVRVLTTKEEAAEFGRS